MKEQTYQVASEKRAKKVRKGPKKSQKRAKKVRKGQKCKEEEEEKCVACAPCVGSKGKW